MIQIYGEVETILEGHSCHLDSAVTLAVQFALSLGVLLGGNRSSLYFVFNLFYDGIAYIK